MNKMKKLNGMRVLLFSQYFFGYEEKIANKMRDQGAEVTLYDEMSITAPIERAFLKISARLFDKKTEKYYSKILLTEKDKNYDFVLFIDCEMPTHRVLQDFKDSFPEAKFCLHMWDSLENLKGVKEKFKFFDYISTFDRKDSLENSLVFRPLFYCDSYRENDKKIIDYIYDISFIGTIHSDRYAIIKKIKNKNIYIYPFLQSKFIYYFYFLTKSEFRNTKINDFKFEKIDSQKISDIVCQSKAVLDIQHPKQTGLTMRTLEMLGMKKKFITTNIDIINYDFYNKNNICIIDRDNPVIPDDFFESPYIELPNNVYEFYSLDQWTLGVLGVQNG